MPPLASWNMPARAPMAPVKAPRSWPNISDSSSSAGMAPQFTGMNGRSARELMGMNRARDQLLAGAALAHDEDRRVRGRDLPDELRDLLDQRMLADQQREGFCAVRSLRSQYASRPGALKY